MMDLARRTRMWAISLEQAQHPFTQVAHGAQHHHLGQQGDLCVPQPPRQAVCGLGRALGTAHQCVFARTHTPPHTPCVYYLLSIYTWAVLLCMLSCVLLFATPPTIAHVGPWDFPGKNTRGPTQLEGQQQAEDHPGHIQDTESSVM